ncbi:hypothetical protein WJX81_006580 [Elliptochloris bilobata]|uniref:Dihydrolipoamide acetyltransferase component of pyruvate dehydrogenase complex n=1 Tax=Elliptochloris bilobata TaxID=381761 RepID=A0AAW1QY30_9CHLO
MIRQTGQIVFKKAHRPAWVTAVMFCRRYYAIKSLQRNDLIIFAIAALHLAGKVEDDQQKLDKVIHSIFMYRYKDDKKTLGLLSEPKYHEELRESVLTAERALLYALGFQLNIEHPHYFAMRVINDLARQDGAVGVFWRDYMAKHVNGPSGNAAVNFLNDSTQQQQHCLLYDLRWIALSAIQASLKESGMINTVPLVDGRAWYKQQLPDPAIPYEVLELISEEMREMYDTSVSQPPDAGGKAAAAAGGSAPARSAAGAHAAAAQTLPRPDAPGQSLAQAARPSAHVPRAATPPQATGALARKAEPLAILGGPPGQQAGAPHSGAGAPAGAFMVGGRANARAAPMCAVKEIFMPALSSTMTEGKIVSWLKGPGDKVSKGESVVVVESDKADMDVESFSEGILGAIVIPEGGVANVGEPIAYIAETADDLEAAKSRGNGAGGNGASTAAPAAPTLPVAEEKKPEPVAAGAVAATPAPAAAAQPPPPPPPPPAAPAPTKRTDGRIIATPYAKKLAKDLGVSLETVAGSGPNGRITASDVEAMKNGGGISVAAPPAAAPAPAAAAPAAAPAPAMAAAAKAAGTTVAELRGKTVPFTSLQMAVSRNMVESLKVPEFRVSYMITTDAFDALYKRLKPKGVTLTALLAKAAGVALASHPLLYASTTADGAGVTYNERINVALAVAMPDGGLITPVIKDADSTDIYQISRNWADLVKRARAKQLAPDEFTSGTFTISNLGNFGADSFDAILPPGTAAILAVGGSKPTVTADAAGRIGVQKQMTVNLTADHRIVYGADAAEFLLTLKSVIENPEQLTL